MAASNPECYIKECLCADCESICSRCRVSDQKCDEGVKQCKRYDKHKKGESWKYYGNYNIPR